MYPGNNTNTWYCLLYQTMIDVFSFITLLFKIQIVEQTILLVLLPVCASFVEWLVQCSCDMVSCLQIPPYGDAI